MASDLVTLAEAVKTELNSQLPGWGYSATAVRNTMPVFRLEECDVPRFTVITSSRAVATGGSAGLLETRPVIDIDIRHRTQNDLATNDGLMEFSELVAEHFLASDDAPGDCIEANTTVVFLPQELVDKGLFATTVSLTYLLGRFAR